MNKIRRIWASGGAVVAGWLQIPGALHAEALARCGYDAVVIDLQHSPIDFNAAVAMIGAIEQGGAEPIVRVKWNTPSEIMQLLDMGAYGVIAPMINTAEDARLLASSLHYAPRGERSFGPRRPSMRFGADYWRIASDTIVSLAMIETVEAMDNLDAILAVDGLDGVFIGPTDLALSLGQAPVPDSRESGVVEAVRHIRERARLAGKRVGIFCGSGIFAAEKIREGFDLVTAAPDLSMLTMTARSVIADARKGMYRPQEAIVGQ